MFFAAFMRIFASVNSLECVALLFIAHSMQMRVYCCAMFFIHTHAHTYIDVLQNRLEIKKCIYIYMTVCIGTKICFACLLSLQLFQCGAILAADRAVKCQALIYDRDHFNWNILALYAYRIS